MEKIIEKPNDVNVSKKEDTLIISKGDRTLERTFIHPRVKLEAAEKINIKTTSEKKKDRAIVGTWAAHIKNMIKGVNEDYEYQLKIIYTHFPMSVKVSGDEVQISNFLGEKGIRKTSIIGKTTVNIDKEIVTVKGANKEEVGQTAANIEQLGHLSKKDRRRFIDGIYIIKKAD